MTISSKRAALNIMASLSFNGALDRVQRFPKLGAADIPEDVQNMIDEQRNINNTAQNELPTKTKLPA